MQKIPFHIISGFLGSGKTTLLKRIIETYSTEKRIGIIQNEFAPSNIDGTELKSLGKDFHLLEINNGSVFCVCLLGDFTRSLEKFVDHFHPDVLFIEASGLSDTTSVSEVISAGSLSEKIYLASNWCIVDALNYKKAGIMKQRITHQVRMADVVLINKTDLIPGKFVQLEKEIRDINPFAEIKKTVFCNVDFEAGNSPIIKFYFTETKPLARPAVQSMVIKTSRTISWNSLTLFLHEWAPRAYRIKGYVNLKEKSTVAVQCTFDVVNTTEVQNNFYPTEIIAITDQFTLHDWNRAFKALS